MTADQPLGTTTIRRPFHWGIVVLTPAGTSANVPDVPSDEMVSTNGEGLVVLVRHAQDIESFEGDFTWAEAEIVVRQLVEPPKSDPRRREVFRGLVDIPSGSLAIGDADGDVVVPAHEGANLVVVSVDPSLPVDDFAPDAVHVDLYPA